MSTRWELACGLFLALISENFLEEYSVFGPKRQLSLERSL